MKNNKLVIENGQNTEKYDILLNIDVAGDNYIIYTKREKNEFGDIIAYAGNYEFLDGVQSIRPVEDEEILEFLDMVLLNIQSKMNGSEIDE